MQSFESIKTKNESIIYNTIGRGERLLHNFNIVVDEAHNARHFVASERMVKSSEETVVRNTQIVNLQATAEFALFFVLVPYYIAHDLSETAHAFVSLIVDAGKHEHLIHWVEHLIHWVDLVSWLFAVGISGWFGARWFAKYYPDSLPGKVAINLQKFLLWLSIRKVVFLIYFLNVVCVLILIYLSLPGHFPG